MNSRYIKQCIINEHPIENDIFENFFHTDVILELREPIILEAEHAYNVYYHRSMIQKEVTKANIMGYETLLKNLKNQKNNISLYIIRVLIGTIVCFFDENENLLGVLWNPDK